MQLRLREALCSESLSLYCTPSARTAHTQPVSAKLNLYPCFFLFQSSLIDVLSFSFRNNLKCSLKLYLMRHFMKQYMYMIIYIFIEAHRVREIKWDIINNRGLWQRDFLNQYLRNTRQVFGGCDNVSAFFMTFHLMHFNMCISKCSIVCLK